MIWTVAADRFALSVSVTVSTLSMAVAAWFSVYPVANHGRKEAKLPEVLVGWPPKRRQAARDPPSRTSEDFVRVRMSAVRRTDHSLRLLLRVDLERLLDIERRENVAAGMREVHASPRGYRRVRREGDRNREEQTAGETHGPEARLVVRPAHETAQWSEGAGLEHFKVVQRARSQGEFHDVRVGSETSAEVNREARAGLSGGRPPAGSA